MSNQMLINQVLTKPQLTFDNFNPTSNEELINILNKRFPPVIYIWGFESSGKTHLLKALQNKYGGVYFDSKSFPKNSMDLNTEEKNYFLDDIHVFSAEQYDALFYLFTKLQISGTESSDVSIAICSNKPPKQLEIREDLRNRFGWGLVYELQTLSDESLRVAMIQRAREMGWDLPNDVIKWLYSYCSRDLKFLFNLIDSLDMLSLSERRTITIPFVKDVISRLESSRL